MAQPPSAKAVQRVPEQQCLFSCSPFTQMLLELLDVHDELVQLLEQGHNAGAFPWQ